MRNAKKLLMYIQYCFSSYAYKRKPKGFDKKLVSVLFRLKRVQREIPNLHISLFIVEQASLISEVQREIPNLHNFFCSIMLKFTMRLERSIDVLLKETQSGNKSGFNPVFINRQLDFRVSSEYRILKWNRN